MAPRTATGSGRRPPTRATPSNQRPARQDRRPNQVQGAKRQRAEQARRARHRKVWVRSGLSAGAAVLILLIVFLTGGHGGAGSYTYKVGSPGPGATAPDFTLPSNMGGTFNLAAQRGKTVLIFFQEGTDCQPCWTQLQAIQHDMAGFHHAGINEVVSITTDPLGALQQAASTYGTTIPVLSDPTLTVSHAYDANSYGMMGTSMDGHSFIVVGPNGRIEWRADYGGAPNYTMYVPVPTLLAQMRAGMGHHSAS
ncbi:MAG: peroxiredoxin family protein [Actinomycetota bacterium]|nr:peroxiredoxin family protein [Actinomycetota bacterium]MDA8302165.1 peroxiredoxin family protein [Actinomycetota bacterium]